MAFIIDRETKQFWKAYGCGTTSVIALACDYPDSVAFSLQRLYHEDCYVVAPNDMGQLIEHECKPDPKSSPLTTKVMKENNLMWVAFENKWMAVDRQSLALGTLLAMNTHSPFSPVAA